MLDSDLTIRLSTKSGSAGNTLASTPAASLGKYVSTTPFDLETPLNNLFDDVTAAEEDAGDTEYRCLFIYNASPTDDAEVWVQSPLSGVALLTDGRDPTGASAVGSASAQAIEIADENTAPAGIGFDFYVGFDFPFGPWGAARYMGTIPAGFVKAFWIRRIVEAGEGGVDLDTGTLRLVAKEA